MACPVCIASFVTLSLPAITAAAATLGVAIAVAQQQDLAEGGDNGNGSDDDYMNMDEELTTSEDIKNDSQPNDQENTRT